MNRLLREPALVAGFVQSLLVLLVVFGVDLSDEQVAAILTLTSAVLALVTRSLVSPIKGDAQ